MGLLATIHPHAMDPDQHKDPWQFDTTYIFNPICDIFKQSTWIKSCSHTNCSMCSTVWLPLFIIEQFHYLGPKLNWQNELVVLGLI